MTNEQLSATRAQVTEMQPQIQADLERLVAIPSINFPGYDLAPVHQAAEAVAELLRDAGAGVELVTGDDGIPTVVGTVAGPEDAPLVVLYAHYDVQPGSDPEAWQSPAFEPQVRDGRLYGRGAADDKSGVVAHIATARALAPAAPVRLRILIEGAEEYGGDFEEWPTTQPHWFADADAVVVADMGPVALGTPTFTTALRGIVSATVTVRTLEGPAHSGLFGGPAPDALMVLIKLLATLVDDAGDCAIDGVPGSDWPGADYDEAQWRDLAGVLDGVPLVGTGSIASRLVSRPSVTVVGLDAPSVDTAPNALNPQARAKVSLRVPPGVAADSANEALREHLQRHAPWGVAVEVTTDPPAAGTAIRTGGPAYQVFADAMRLAYDTEPTQQGMGGAVPFVANLVAAFPDLEVLGVGAQDPGARIHAPNESLDLAELHRYVLAQLVFLHQFGARS